MKRWVSLKKRLKEILKLGYQRMDRISQESELAIISRET
jgi:hypothetical protein